MALTGIKVIEFAGLAPAPFCGKILRDMGARVIRIDKTENSQSQDRLSHGKESIAINLKNKDGIEIVKRLTKNADVLIEPFRRGVMERLGLGPNILCTANPKLVYARLTGYGQFGQLSEKAGHDINYISYSGVLSCLGRSSENPNAPLNLLADFAGGGLMCALAILGELYKRTNTIAKSSQLLGANDRVIDLSMVEGSAYLSSWLWSSRSLPGLWSGAKRGESLLDGGYPVYETYETKDGQFMACGALEPAFYHNLLKGLELEATDEITKEVLEKKFKAKTQSEWIETFRELDACVSPVLSLENAPLNEHNRERDSFIKLDDGTYMPTMNWLKQKSSNRHNFALPTVGQHSRCILQELDFSRHEIDAFVREKVIEECHGKAKL